MGFLHIGQADFMTPIDDRTLAHLKVVMLSSLRRGEGISFTIRRDASRGSGRETFWIHPWTDLRFQFAGGRAPQLNHTWLRQMAEACASSTGLYIMEEPREQPRPVTAPVPVTPVSVPSPMTASTAAAR